MCVMQVIPKFKAVFVRFDKEYAYGDEHEEFKKVALAATSQPELIVAEVPIQGLYNFVIYQ